MENQKLLIKKSDIHKLSGGPTGEPTYTWHDLVANGYIEYIDTEEEETTMIAMTVRDILNAQQDPLSA